MERKTILLVDDSMTTLLLEKMILKNTLHEILTATDGDEAIRLATQVRPDLILLDVVMPRRDGFDVCRALRQQESTRATPIILVTTSAAGLERGFTCGCSDYVTKPINGTELLLKVRRQLGEGPDGNEPRQ